MASAVDESLFKQQKEFFLRQQLAAIQCELSASKEVSVIQLYLASPITVL